MLHLILLKFFILMVKSHFSYCNIPRCILMILYYSLKNYYSNYLIFYSMMMTQVYWTFIINFSSTFQNITLNTWFHSFDTVTKVMYLIYHFIYFNVNFTIYFQCGFYQFPSQTPLPSPTLYGYLGQWYIRHTQRRACYCFLCLSEYGELTQQKHPLLHFLTKCSQCHQPQDHDGHQQIPANPQPPYPSTTISLKSKLIKSLELIWEKVWENQGKFYT